MQILREFESHHLRHNLFMFQSHITKVSSTSIYTRVAWVEKLVDSLDLKPNAYGIPVRVRSQAPSV